MAEEAHFFQKMDYFHLKRRNQTYPMVIKKLIKSAPYQMRFIKDLFLNYDSSLKDLCDQHLNKQTIFQITDQHGNGILHYLCKTTEPKIVPFFFHCFGKQKFGLKEAIIRPNEAGETPLLLLIQNLSLERFKVGYQGMFGQRSQFLEKKLEGVVQKTLFDQILTFFEYNLEPTKLQFEQTYTIFNEMTKVSTIDPHLNHGKKVERWVREHLFTQINAIDPISGTSLFHQAMKRNNCELMKYLVSYKHLDNQTTEFGTLYDFFEFACRTKEGEASTKKWIIDHFLLKINEVDPLSGSTILHQASKARQIPFVICLINLGANPDIRDRKQNFASDYLNTSDLDELYEIFYQVSMSANKSLKTWVSTYLLNKINTIDPEDGMTLLHKGIKNKEHLLIEFLIDQGAKTDIQNRLGQTAASQILLESGEDATLLYQMFNSATHHQGSKFEQWIKKELCIGIDLRHPTNGDTLFHRAAKEKNAPLIVYLVQLRAKSEIENFDKRTPVFYIANDFNLLYDLFHRASQAPLSTFGDWMRNNLLYRMNAPIGPFNVTLLHYACMRKDVDYIVYLIALGADSEIESSEKKTALSYIKGDFDLLYALFNRASQTETSLFEEWVRSHLFDTVHTLHHSPTNIIHRALQSKKTRLFAYLEKYGTKPFTEPPVKKKDSPASIAGIKELPIHIRQSKSAATPHDQVSHTNQSHSIKKRAVKKDPLLDNRFVFVPNQSPPFSTVSSRDHISTKKKIFTISHKEDQSLVMHNQPTVSIYETGLLFTTILGKRQTKAKAPSHYREIQMKPLLHEQTLHTLDKQITRLIDSNKKERHEALQLRQEWDKLKNHFAYLLKKSPISKRHLRQFEKDLNALKWRVTITDNFQQVIEKIDHA